MFIGDGQPGFNLKALEIDEKDHSNSFEIFESRKNRDSCQEISWTCPFGPGNQDLLQKKNWSWPDGWNKRLKDPVRLTVMKMAAEICYAWLHLRIQKYAISILVRPVIRANKINPMQKLTPLWILLRFFIQV